MIFATMELYGHGMNYPVSTYYSHYKYNTFAIFCQIKRKEVYVCIDLCTIHVVPVTINIKEVTHNAHYI